MRDWNNKFNILKNLKNCQPRILYPAELSFRKEKEIKAFPEKHKQSEFITTSLTLQEMLKGHPPPEMKRQKYTKL